MAVHVHQQSFSIVRHLARSPAQVFSAWADPAKKRQWMTANREQAERYTMDFSVGGREYGSFDNEMGHHENETRYFEIIENALIVFSYSMAMNGRVHSVSLVTVQFVPESGGTQLSYDEQMSIIAPSDGVAGREHGWNALLDAMEAQL